MKPWTSIGWLNFCIHDRWEMLKLCLAASGETLGSKNIKQYDYEIAEQINAYGGFVSVCEHGELHFANLPCDLCWSKSEQKANQ